MKKLLGTDLFCGGGVEYRDIPEFPGYRVGSDGSVWSAWSRREATEAAERGPPACTSRH